MQAAEGIEKGLKIKVAITSAELRAAASLRAAAFSHDTITRSDFALQVIKLDCHSRLVCQCVHCACASSLNGAIRPRLKELFASGVAQGVHGDRNCVMQSTLGLCYSSSLCLTLLHIVQSHRRMKADEEWGALERKLAGTEAGWEVPLTQIAG